MLVCVRLCDIVTTTAPYKTARESSARSNSLKTRNGRMRCGRALVARAFREFGSCCEEVESVGAFERCVAWWRFGGNAARRRRRRSVQAVAATTLSTANSEQPTRALTFTRANRHTTQTQHDVYTTTCTYITRIQQHADTRAPSAISATERAAAHAPNTLRSHVSHVC